MSDFILEQLSNLLIPAVIPEVSYKLPLIFPPIIAGLFSVFIGITLVRLIAKLL